MNDSGKRTALEKKWLVFYTKSRHERKVEQYLLKRGYEVFLPVQKIMRQWSDRKKKVEVPLFNSYIFVHETEDKIPQLLQAPGMAWNIRYNDKPAILYPKELDIIRRFLTSGFFVESSYENLALGEVVEVVDGPLKNLKGTLIRTSEGNKFSVLLESIQQNVIVTLDPKVLKSVLS